MTFPPILLASSSPYRRTLLEKLGIPFECASPDIDERMLDAEEPEKLVARLAREKAGALQPGYPGHWIIGSDQVAVTEAGAVLTKPLNHEGARAQLSQCSGQRVRFLTGLCLLNASNGRAETVVEPFDVYFRTLSAAQIERYLRLEQPYDCAGSFRAEGLGITLFRRLSGDDPNALVGLPLIRLVDLLLGFGFNCLAGTLADDSAQLEP